LKREIRAKPDICVKLHFEPAKGVKRLQFLLLEYRFFRDSEEDTALPLNLPWILSPLSLMIHIVKSRALTLLRLPCCFVKLKTKTVGVWAVQEHQQSLLVASLGVAKEYRRLGIGMCILGHIEAIANHIGKKQMKVDVLTKNIPAQRLYTKYGFTFIQQETVHHIVRGKKPLQIAD
jgi:ribosomal protein S18 acetylase RimI-like enzyme